MFSIFSKSPARARRRPSMARFTEDVLLANPRRLWGAFIATKDWRAIREHLRRAGAKWFAITIEATADHPAVVAVLADQPFQAEGVEEHDASTAAGWLTACALFAAGDRVQASEAWSED